MADDLSVAASVTRTSLGLGDLSLSQAGVYEVVSAGPGTKTPILNEVSGRYVSGSAVVNVTWGRGTLPLVVRVYGSTHAQLAARTAALVAAFSQKAYQVTLTLGGQTSTWKCHAATIAPAAGDTLNKFELMNGAPMQTYNLSIPRQPTPVAGAL